MRRVHFIALASRVFWYLSLPASTRIITRQTNGQFLCEGVSNPLMLRLRSLVHNKLLNLA